MRAYYDLHIHSALSPCGDEDMTPNNIVNMSIIKGLDVIAVTDHNSCGNVRAVMEVADGKILVIPAMELETAEEVHITCYFPDIESAEAFWEVVKAHSRKIKKRPEIFGRQLYMNSDDEIVGEEENLLVTATYLGIEEAFKEVRKLGGVPVLAHIDRDSYSVISNLGFIPEGIDAETVEITPKNSEKLKPEYGQYRVLTNSDAHYLEDIMEKENFIEVSTKSIDEFLGEMTNKKNGENIVF